jgi:hypothetical protein
MSPVLPILLVFAPSVGLTALLIGLPYAVMKRKARRLARPSLTANRPQPPVLGNLQLTTVLAEPGEVLLGYRAVDDSTRSRRLSTGVSPSPTGTLLLSLGHDAEKVLSILDDWRQQGVELALRLSDGDDLVILYDRHTAQRLVFSQPRSV